MPPSVLPDPPTCTVPPVIQMITGVAVGDSLALTIGTFTGNPTYVYAWTRDGAAIPGATTRVYILADADLDAMVGATTTATNMGGSISVDSDPIGPVVPAP